jgi:hypothetical protein
MNFKLALIAFAAVHTVAAADTWKVMGGSSVGPIVLGNAYKGLQTLLTPQDAMATQGGAYLRFKEGIELEIQNQKVVQIVVHQLNFMSKQGAVDILLDGNLKIGSTVSQMEAALGRGYEARSLPVAKSQPPAMYYAYKAKGLGVRTVAGRAVEYSVWPRR